MPETLRYTLETILDHITVCQKRFLEIKTPSDFADSDRGTMILDAITTRLQAMGENIKRLIPNNSHLETTYPKVEWQKIILFRDFISHHYEKLDHEIIFDICKTDLPELKLAIVAELNLLKK